MTQDTWQARLQLYFTRTPTRTVLSQRHHQGPLQVQRPFYPESNDTCHVYLLHPPAGIVGGDQLQIQVHVATAANVLLTTPAATKLYTHPDVFSQQTIQLSVADNAVLEWFPQETIAFENSRSRSEIEVMLHTDSIFMGWDIVCLGRSASHAPFTQGEFQQRLKIQRVKQRLWIERAHYQGGSPLLHQMWGLANQPVIGSFFTVAPFNSEMQDTVRQALIPWLQQSRCLCAITIMEDLLVARYLGQHAEEAKAFFIDLWRVIRPMVANRVACPPRIWAT
ncbi:urease accessory protein UreH [Beggiatoa alba B18LD]|uniref:Urease accessory protein UreD n=1 Tax=Beggiatoa alba B18LD TaxID=395493 RepID=I3CKK1_9GAMM|nr:urease accessory protein UreD [Beggiatoa alba]EIJ44144.1 urease accessory protein UreH [Beggiatoa alba B18LD]